MMKFLALFMAPFLITTQLARAENVCWRTAAELKNQFDSESLRIAFRNQGGFAHSAVCWWHSRLQRSVVYLTEYAPNRPKPTPRQAEAIIQNLIDFKKVVVIPGYHSFYDFSIDHEAMIQHQLDLWQLQDALVNQAWIKGLQGNSSLSPRDLSAHMNQMYKQFKYFGPGLWYMVQLPGVAAHAFILIDMSPISGGGFDLRVIDSNDPLATRTLPYRPGDRSMDIDGAPFVPYIGYNDDIKKITNALHSYCRKK